MMVLKTTLRGIEIMPFNMKDEELLNNFYEKARTPKNLIKLYNFLESIG